MWVYRLKPDGLCLFSGSRGGDSQGLVPPQAVAWAVTRGRGPRQGCPPPARPSSDREAQGRYRVRLLLLLHQEHIAPQGQLCRQLLILLPQPVDDLLERHLQLPTVVREGLQPSPGRRARTVRWQTDRQTGEEQVPQGGEAQHRGWVLTPRTSSVTGSTPQQGLCMAPASREATLPGGVKHGGTGDSKLKLFLTLEPRAEDSHSVFACGSERLWLARGAWDGIYMSGQLPGALD